MVQRSLRMREARGSIPRTSKLSYFFHLLGINCFRSMFRDRLPGKKTYSSRALFSPPLPRRVVSSRKKEIKPRKRGAASQSMDSELEEAVCKLAWLNFACARDDLDSGAALLAELKVLLTRLPSLPPLFEKTPKAVEELKIARAIYENAVILSLKIKDREAFERSLCQLKEFYINTCGIIAPSPDEYPFLGLNLLRLLAENRIAEFHTELELLPLEALSHPCIKYAVELEQSFMEGAYNRLINAHQAVPHETYVYLMDLLAETIRDEVAECSVEAYDYLPISVAKKMLMFTSDQELLEYISEEQPEWEIKDYSVHFDMAKPKSHMDLSSFKLIRQALSYARELEHVV